MKIILDITFPTWAVIATAAPIVLAIGAIVWRWWERRPHLEARVVAPSERNRLLIEVKNIGNAAARGIQWTWSTGTTGPQGDPKNYVIIDLVDYKPGALPSFLDPKESYVITLVSPEPLALLIHKTHNPQIGGVIGQIDIRYQGDFRRQFRDSFVVRSPKHGQLAADLSNARVERLSEK